MRLVPRALVGWCCLLIGCASESPPPAPLAPSFDLSSCTSLGEEDELIAKVYGDGDIDPGEYSFSGPFGTMYVVAPPNTNRGTGALSAEKTNNGSQREKHDINGNGSYTDESGCEQHIIANGEHAVSFRQFGGPQFTRSIAMLDYPGVPWDVPGTSESYQDLVLAFDIGTGAPTLTGDFRAGAPFAPVPASGEIPVQYSTASPTIASGDALWFLSTFLPPAPGTGPEWYGLRGRAVLNQFNFDYGRNPGAFRPAVNSFGETNVNYAWPLMHVFAAPGASTTFTVRLRTVLPTHRAMEDGTLQTQSMTVTVAGDTAGFTTAGTHATGQLVTFTALTMRGDAYFEYQWVFDGVATPWQASRTIQRSFATGGAHAVQLLVRNASGEGPTVSYQRNVNILGVTLTGPDDITVSGEYTWFAAPSGGTGYSYQWYYQPQGGAEVPVSTGFPPRPTKYTRTVTYQQPLGFRIRVRVTSGADTTSAQMWVNNGGPL